MRHTHLSIGLLTIRTVFAIPQVPTSPPSGGFQIPQQFQPIIDGLTQALGIITVNGTLDVAASVCSTFKEGNQLGNLLSQAFGSPYAGGGQCVKDTSGGSGPYNAHYTTDPTLPAHTIYAPKVAPPADVELPVIIWGNGACLAVGTMFANFLTEIASHGFVIIANGEPTFSGMTTFNELLKSIDWATTNPAVKKYGNVNPENLIIAGQSCGGMEAYQASFNTTKSKMTVLFNSGFLNPLQSGDIKRQRTPIAYFEGGPKDIAYTQGLRDYNNLPADVPALFADADIGHIGSYYQAGGGITGKAAVAFFKWKLKGDESQKSLFCNPAPDSLLVKAGYNITSKNGMC